jgi:diketogulonate reductase-like aldo/keto reductase
MSSSDETTTVALANGVQMPRIGFGCAFGDWTGQSDFQGFLPEQAWRTLSLALETGYRAFDGAHCYGTERHMGDVFGRALAAGDIEREDLFLTTKLAHPPTPPEVAISHRRTWDWSAVPDIAQRVADDFDFSKEQLGIGYFDLVLMHWPGPFDNEDRAFAREARATIWKFFETLLERGEARAIGVSNFSERHLSELMEDGSVAPMVNQIELHPYCQNPELVKFCQDRDIVVEAYAPFASGSVGLFDDPVIREIADAAGRSPGQVILRWHLQHGHVVLPKSTHRGRMAENLNLFDFSLDDEAMQKIDALAPEDPKRSTQAPDAIA